MRKTSLTVSLFQNYITLYYYKYDPFLAYILTIITPFNRNTYMKYIRDYYN